MKSVHLLVLILVCPFFFSCAAQRHKRLTSPECGIKTEVLFPEPEKLIEDFVLRDRRGEFLRDDSRSETAWLAKAAECPNQLKAPPVVMLVESVRIAEILGRSSSRVRARVEYRVVGTVSDSEHGRVASKEEPFVISQTVTALQTPFGWRLQTPQAGFVGIVNSKAYARGLPAKTSKVFVNIAFTPNRWGEHKLTTAWQVYIDFGARLAAEQLLKSLKSAQEAEGFSPLLSEIALLKVRAQKRDQQALAIAFGLAAATPGFERQTAIRTLLTDLMKSQPAIFIEAVAAARKRVGSKRIAELVVALDDTGGGATEGPIMCELWRRKEAIASVRTYRKTAVKREILAALQQELDRKACN